MKQYIQNILNPPEKIKRGQIWKNHETRRLFLITDDTDADKKIFRSIALTFLVKELDDNIDIILNKEKFNFLSRDYLALRLTDGPVHKSQLDFYYGTIDQKTYDEIKQTLKKRTVINYDENQQLLFEDILEEVNEIREEAIGLYEKLITAKEKEEENFHAAIIQLFTEKPEFTEEPYIPATLAAKDEKSREKEFKFWEKELPEAKTVTLFQLPQLEVEFAVTKSGIYLLLYSGEEITIENIAIKQNGKIIEPEKKNYDKIEANERVAIYFDRKKIEKGEAELIFKFNEQPLRKKVIFE